MCDASLSHVYLIAVVSSIASNFSMDEHTWTPTGCFLNVSLPFFIFLPFLSRCLAFSRFSLVLSFVVLVICSIQHPFPHCPYLVFRVFATFAVQYRLFLSSFKVV